MKTGRNEPCPCGSGKKYKKCHLGQRLAPIKHSSKSVGELPMQTHKELFKYNQELKAVADAIMEKEYPSGYDKQFFTAFCVGKAYKTHAAVLLLCERGYGQDGAILVRSMLEMLITLLFIHKDPTDYRMQRYYAYDWVLRKKMFDYAKSKPSIVKLMKERSENPNLGDVSTEEVEKKAKEAKEKYNYGRDWSEKNLREMAEEVGRIDLYLSVYRLQSQIVHTSTRVINEYVKPTSRGYTIEVGQNSQWVEEALVAAFDCFFNILMEYDKLLNIGYEKQLRDIETRYVTEVDSINMKAEEVS